MKKDEIEIYNEGFIAGMKFAISELGKQVKQFEWVTKEIKKIEETERRKSHGKGRSK